MPRPRRYSLTAKHTQAIISLGAEDPTRTNQEIAERVGVSETSVSRIRAAAFPNRDEERALSAEVQGAVDRYMERAGRVVQRHLAGEQTVEDIATLRRWGVKYWRNPGAGVEVGVLG